MCALLLAYLHWRTFRGWRSRRLSDDDGERLQRQATTERSAGRRAKDFRHPVSCLTKHTGSCYASRTPSILIICTALMHVVSQVQYPMRRRPNGASIGRELLAVSISAVLGCESCHAETEDGRRMNTDKGFVSKTDWQHGFETSDSFSEGFGCDPRPGIDPTGHVRKCRPMSHVRLPSMHVRQIRSLCPSLTF